MSALRTYAGIKIRLDVVWMIAPELSDSFPGTEVHLRSDKGQT